MDNNLQPTFANGKICYMEIPALDIQQSSKFYQTVFGWNIREDNEGNISFDDTVGQVSGMWVLDREPTTKPGLLISIMVYSISDTLKLIMENNGKVVQVPDNNAREVVARFSDPAGNVLCLYQGQESINV
jgi:predicted enzyme related to lactoylglutathione lyase